MHSTGGLLSRSVQDVWTWNKHHVLHFVLPPSFPFCLSLFPFHCVPLPHTASKCKTFTPFEANTWFYNYIRVLCVCQHYQPVCVRMCVFPWNQGLLMSTHFSTSLVNIFQNGSRATGKEHNKNVFLLSQTKAVSLAETNVTLLSR